MANARRSLDDSLATIRGSLKPARANARSVAALTSNPGCSRRRVLDAARVRSFELAEALGHAPTRGQSPFAITTGNSFEQRLKGRSEYALLAQALAPFVKLPEAPTVRDLGTKIRKGQTWDAWLRERAQKTDEVLAAIARGDADAPHIVDHPVLTFPLGGVSVFLEPDALAFRVGSKLELVEIKSYAVIDDQADPTKLASTSGQVAVYFIALRATLARLGFDASQLNESLILVTPRNFGRTPTAHRVPIRKKVAAIERVLRTLPKTGDLLDQLSLPTGFTLDIPVKVDDTAARGRLEGAVRSLPMLYTPECLASCDMAKYCRHQAVADDEPSRLGRSARDTLAGVHRLADALRLATSGPRADEPDLADVAEVLRNAKAALERARAASKGRAL